MKFEKYHCLQNDFIITENICLNVSSLCDNHKGIGADGLIVVENNNILFFNKDGSKAKFCGNGIRCAAMYINNKFKKNIDFLVFEGIKYKILNKDNLYTIIHNISSYKKIKKYFLVDSGVMHLVTFDKPNEHKALYLQKKYNANITFFYENNAKTFEKGVGFTKGCGSGLISIMSVLYKEKNIDFLKIYSDNLYSNVYIKNNLVHLESEVHFIYKGEIIC